MLNAHVYVKYQPSVSVYCVFQLRSISIIRRKTKMFYFLSASRSIWCRFFPSLNSIFRLCLCHLVCFFLRQFHSMKLYFIRYRIYSFSWTFESSISWNCRPSISTVHIVQCIRIAQAGHVSFEFVPRAACRYTRHTQANMRALRHRFGRSHTHSARP